MLRLNSKGSEVRDLQVKLNEFLGKHNQALLVTDGHFGEKTEDAVIFLQEKK